jgi:hypothetical protein
LTGTTLWIASYPKSGNTWARAVLSAWRTGRPVRLNELEGEGVAARIPFDDALGILSSDLTGDEAELLRPRVDELLAQEASHRIVRKAHDGFYPGPAGEPAFSASATSAALYVVRDPRDVAVSLAHHNGRDFDWAAAWMNDPNATMGESKNGLELQLRQRIGTWSQHVRSWLDDAPFPVHALRYEDCLARPTETFGEALRAASIGPVEDADVARAVERASFERLREAEAVEGFRERPGTAIRFFRSGRAGAWRDELSPHIAARIEAAHGELMSRFGYL